jgi:hypothetical protein
MRARRAAAWGRFPAVAMQAVGHWRAPFARLLRWRVGRLAFLRALLVGWRQGDSVSGELVQIYGGSKSRKLR